MKKISLLVVVLTLTGRLFAQTTLSNNPASLTWSQINTPHFRVIYPTGFDEQAQRMANTLEHIHEPAARTLGSFPRKISVVLQNQSSVSNGFVSMTPRRTEFYAMPSQNYNFSGTNDWLNMLATHEYRHIAQNQHAARGFSKVFYYVFGGNTFSAITHLAAPSWFWEGDAVATETALTHSGRGRIPNFNLVFKTNLMEGRIFNYQKQYLRSYKHNIPDHYVLGYNMISYLRKRTNDPEIWGKVTAQAWNVPFIPFSFSSAIKRKSGLYVNALYTTMAADLKKEWQAEIDNLELTTFKTINPRRSKAYTDYEFPQPLSDGTVLVMKQGIGNIEEFCILKNGKEIGVFTPGPVNGTGMLSAANSKVIWNEYGYNPRWNVKNFSLIKVYDFETKRKQVIGSRQARYAGAALSPDSKLVVTVRTDNQYKTNLVVLALNSGREEKTFANPENYFYSMARWSDDGKKIVVLKTTLSGKTVSLIDYASGQMTDLFPISHENIGYPVLWGNYLFYNSPVSGIDNVYMVDLSSTKKFQVTTSKYGAYNASVSTDGKVLYYNEQTRNGLDVAEIPMDVAAWKSYVENVPAFKPLSTYLAEQEGMPGLLDSVPNQKFQVKRYSKLKGIINPHSWGPFVTNNLAQANVGIMSQDVLSTTSINAGYQFDIVERTGLWKAGVSYQGLYPIIDAEVTHGNRQLKARIFDRDVKFSWRETGISAGLRVPLVLTRSKYFSKIEIGNSFGAIQVSDFKNEVTEGSILISSGNERYVAANDTLLYIFNDRVGNGNLLFNKASVSFTRLLKVSRRDFNPRLGQTLDLEYYSTPYGGDFKGGLWMAQSTLYFPGWAKHHSFYMRGGYQQKQESTSLDIYSFRNRLFKPRGHSYPNDTKFYSIAFNYALPLWYPDIHIGPFLNIQRIKMNLFYDEGRGEGRSYVYDVRKPDVVVGYYDNSSGYKSAGVEMTFDINVFRLLPQFEVGFRGTYVNKNRFTNGGIVFEFLIGNIPF
jgi:Tol biopolymer transport system component